MLTFFFYQEINLVGIQNANSDQPSIGCGFNVSSVTKMLKTSVLYMYHPVFSLEARLWKPALEALAQFTKSLVGILLKIRPKHIQRRGKLRSS